MLVRPCMLASGALPCHFHLGAQKWQRVRLMSVCLCFYFLIFFGKE
jgi:hypothetical protein